MASKSDKTYAQYGDWTKENNHHVWSRSQSLKFHYTKKRWLALFREAGLALLDTISCSDAADANNPDSAEGMAFITARANELIAKHPDNKDIFEGYIRSQQNEYDDIDGNLVCVT